MDRQLGLEFPDPLLSRREVYLLWNAPPRTSRLNTLDLRIRVLSETDHPSATDPSGRLTLLGGFSFESGEAGGEGAGFVGGDRERRGPFHQLCEGEGFVAVERCGVDVRVFGDADGVDDHEPFFGFGVGGGGLEIGVVDRACASALHLFEVGA